MDQLNSHIYDLKSDLQTVINYLNELDDDNFSSKFSFINNSITKIRNKRELLLEKFSRDDLKKFNSELDFFVKQITDKFDNIIEDKQTQQKLVSAQLKSTLNQKKLVNYTR